MYNILMHIYLLGVAIYSLFNEKVRKMWRGEHQAIPLLKEKVEPGARYVWVHAASLGEFEQGRPIIERIRRQCPELKVLLTFFSPSGYEVRKNYEGADIVCYLPLDTPFSARRFLRAVHPVCAIFIKYEFWYNYLHILKHRNIPVYSVSSIFRPEQIFFRWYGRQYGRVLKCFTHFFVQNEVSRDLLNKIGIHDVTISGDTRFDRVLDIAAQAKQLPVVDEFVKGRKLFVAGSSWQPDEEVFIPYFADKHDWQLVIAPHVIAESHLQQIESLLRQHGRTPVRYTDLVEGRASLTADGKDAALIINCFGLLSSIYRYADITYVGGGFGVGIHNLLEAAVWQKPVIFGPNNARFQEAQELKACGGGIEICCAKSFAKAMDRMLNDASALSTAANAAGGYVRERAGAADTVFEHIFPLKEKTE